MLTAAEIAVFLGVTASAVRHIVRRNNIPVVGKGHNGANLYRAQDVVRHAGAHDRLAS